MRVAVIQSNYIPWKGYFDIIQLADVFITYDVCQYTKNDWRNRNKILTANGPLWLTVPVQSKGNFGQRVCEVRVADSRWATKHWKSILTNYAKSACFEELREPLAKLYQEAGELELLSEVNELFIRGICSILQIRTDILRSVDYQIEGDKNMALLKLLQQVGATEYLSGPSAKMYLDEELFREHGVAVRWMDYCGYPEYTQLCTPFTHAVSVLDLLLNEGAAGAREKMLFAAKGGASSNFQS